MATRNDSTVEALALEAEAVLSRERVEELEHFIQGSGTERRIALAFMSHPWPVHAEQCKDDREHAVLLASCAVLLENPAKFYAEVAELIENARWRIIMAIAMRSDGEEILRKAGALDQRAGQILGEAGANDKRWLQ